MSANEFFLQPGSTYDFSTKDEVFHPNFCPWKLECQDKEQEIFVTFKFANKCQAIMKKEEKNEEGKEMAHFYIFSGSSYEVLEFCKSKYKNFPMRVTPLKFESKNFEHYPQICFVEIWKTSHFKLKPPSEWQFIKKLYLEFYEHIINNNLYIIKNKKKLEN